jgi:adenosylmethionine-8-amino-7-oxononanoate aminotransferase
MDTGSSRYPLWELLGPPSSFGQPERIAVRAQGTHVLYADGRWRLCATSGLWNVNLGYGNPAVARAVAAALTDASYLTLFRAGHEPAIRAARALLDLCGPDHYGRVIFATSGSSANDLVMKLVRQYWSLRRQFGRRVVVGLKGSYHGLTYGSHALTGMQLGQNYYSVDRRLVRHVSHEDPGELATLLAAEGEQIAAVVVEPVLGTGAHPLGPAMLAALDRLRDEYGFLLVADEVATGFGRTGEYFASSRWAFAPDILIASKGITNGTCAVATVQVAHPICDAFDRMDAALTHAETQAGTPATCAAILATIAEMDRLHAVERARELTGRLDQLLADLVSHSLVTGYGGLGCFRALRLGLDGKELPPDGVDTVVGEVRRAGATVQAGPGCVQLVPALVYTPADVEELAGALRTGLDRAAQTLATRSASGVVAP